MAAERDRRSPIVIHDTSSLPLEPPTPEEIERRRGVVAEMLRLRERIGPINLTVEELLAEVEDEVND